MPASVNTSGYAPVPAFPGLTFPWPTVVTAPPGETNRLFIVEKSGIIDVITNLAAPTKTVFLDMSDISSTETLESGTLGMDFHPGYATNGYFFVFFTTQVNGEQHDCIGRFSVDPNNPNHALRASYTVILYQIDPTWNHNAGDLHFGPDGYLYVSLGDPWQNHQQLYNLHSGFLRIDVDKRPGNLLPPMQYPGTTTNYLIPKDNPYIGATSLNGQSIDPTQVRTEFYCIGLRNPWRWCFDSLTGEIYCGDVGEWTWEEIDIIKPGRNYGWDYAEGFEIDDPYFEQYLEPPIYTYSHDYGIAIMGGRVYRGTNNPDLYGNYVFADYGSGQIWSLKYQSNQVSNVRALCNYPAIVCFGTDPRNGDILMADSDMTIQRLAVTNVPIFTNIPPLLSQTGAFADTANLIPARGFQAYDVSVPFWSDNALKQRWLYVPIDQKITFDPTNVWDFPVGTTWVKHFNILTNSSDTNSIRRLETRILVRTVDGAYGVTYEWNAAQTDATLVSASGDTNVISIGNGVSHYAQTWIYPSRNQCLECHTRHSSYALGCNTAQWNHDCTYDTVTTNLLQAMSDAGYFNAPITNHYVLPFLVSATNTNYSLEFRTRSYFAANCVQCHQDYGFGFGNWDARLATALPDAGILFGVLNNDSWMSAVVPGDPDNSMILQRILGNYGQMPPLATTVQNQSAVELVTDWINSLPGRQFYTNWQGYYGFTNPSLNYDTDGDGFSDYGEYLAGTDPNSASSYFQVYLTNNAGHIQIGYPRIPNRIYEVDSTDSLAGAWQPVNAPFNAPAPTSATDTAVVDLGLPGAATRFYRVNIREP